VEFHTIGNMWMWTGFTGLVLFLLFLDLVVFHRHAHKVSVKEAMGWTLMWISLALVFGAVIYQFFGPERALEYYTGYLIEKALSVDNLFVFLVLFNYFAVPGKLQHRVLFWGVLGAMIMRGFFIVVGAVLIQQFHWIIYLFGGFLVYTGGKLLLHKDSDVHPEKNPVIRFFRQRVPMVDNYRDVHFWVKEGGRWMATPLLLVVATVEFTDLVFAVDSIPAIFAITEDPFIVYTSNIFAILGLRSLYFVLAGMMDTFHHLKTGLSFVLMFVGVKMLLAEWYKIPIGVSLGVVAALLVLSILISIVLPKAKEESDQGTGGAGAGKTEAP